MRWRVRLDFPAARRPSRTATWCEARVANASSMARRWYGGEGLRPCLPEAWENDTRCKNFPTSDVGFFRFVLSDEGGAGAALGLGAQGVWSGA